MKIPTTLKEAVLDHVAQVAFGFRKYPERSDEFHAALSKRDWKTYVRPLIDKKYE